VRHSVHARGLQSVSQKLVRFTIGVGVCRKHVGGLTVAHDLCKLTKLTSLGSLTNTLMGAVLNIQAYAISRQFPVATSDK